MREELSLDATPPCPLSVLFMREQRALTVDHEIFDRLGPATADYLRREMSEKIIII